MKIPVAKAAVDQEMWKIGENFGVEPWRKVRSKKEVIDEARTTGAKVHFASLMDICPFEKCWIGGKAPKIQRSSCTPRRLLWKTWFRFLRSIDRTRIISITNDSSKKSWISYPDCQVVMDKQQTQYLAYTQVKMERCSKIIENSKIGMSRHLDSSTTTQMAKIMVQFGRPSRSSRAKSVWSSFGRTVMGKAIWENPVETRLGAGFQLGMLIRTPWQRAILICVCGWHQIGWKETKHWSDVEITQQRSRFGRVQHLSLIMFSLGCTQRQCDISKKYCWQLQGHVLNHEFPRLELKNYHTRKIFVFLRGLMIWKVMPRNVWNVNCELANKTTQQLYKVSTPCIDDHHFKEEELKSVGELSKVCSQIVLKCLYSARIGRPDILWSVNKLAWSIHKMDQGLWQTPESIDILHSSHMWV